ncbi:hypothetical protein QFC22_000470 [Naganishia vaughanmartiniae]|uniref:Uncharacterized protein n=1 Tax=Naganishia vaughanmartiniae TaxID=1424756 RepID=A0ACC2XPZ4_9TREE|nr:hypothetical protein QFC22_000470 [Naganishia vaughanmartiniae]
MAGLIKGLSRRPPRAISSNRLKPSKPSFSPKDYPSKFKVICCSPSQSDDYIDIVIAAVEETAADQLFSLRISLASGEIVKSTASTPVDTATAPLSVFRHLPLAGLRSNIGSAVLEDDRHLHTIETGSPEGHRFRIRTFPKSREEAAQHIYLGSGPVSGLLVLRPVDCEFRPHPQAESSLIKTKCPPALGILLQSGAQLRSVMGRSSRGSATVYLLDISTRGPLQTWKIKVSATQRQLSFKQLKPITTVKAVASGTSGAYDDVQIVKKAGNLDFACERSVFCLACVRVNNGMLRVWDVESARFGSGLEYVFDTKRTVDACAFSPEQAHLLAFAYGNTVAVLSLISYGMKTSWEPVFTVDLPIFSVADITNLAWIPGNSLLVTNNVQALILSDVLDRGDYSSSVVSVVASKQAPLPDAHPENLVQCVIWDKFPLVKLQLGQISSALKGEEVGSCHIDLGSIDAEVYIDYANHPTHDVRVSKLGLVTKLTSDSGRSSWRSLSKSLEIQQQTVRRRLSQLGLYKLSLDDVDTLASLAKTMSYADEQAQALDANGRRFLLAFSRAASNKGELSSADAMWALHSESKIVNLQTTELAEVLARNHFVTEGRNPIPTSIYYFALRKPKTVWGLWRQVSHPERAAMIKFLQNNFEDPRWQSAAVKNAYALLGKQRSQYAAAFFLLGECPKDAIHVCIKQLQDYDLAIFIARTRHDRAILMPWLIATYLQPKAEATGDKWLVHWCHWIQGQREKAIRVLYVPSANQAGTESITAADEYHCDDATNVAVLLSDFKSRAETKKLCATIVPVELEMDIVRYSASRLRAIGCEALALSVIRDWHFTPPPLRATSKHSTDTSSKSTEEQAESSVSLSPLEARPIPKERSAVASVMATGPVQDSKETQGGMEFDMGAFF